MAKSHVPQPRSSAGERTNTLVSGDGAHASQAKWVGSSYVAEGFPYAFVNSIPDVWFTVMGASLDALGLTSLFHLPWNLKFLWGHVLDNYSTKRRWLLGCELVLVSLAVLLALAAQHRSVLVVSSLLFVVTAFAAATHDIAVDGFYLEALEDHEQARWVGLRVAAYRVGLLAGNGGLVVVASYLGWGTAWVIAACVLGSLAVLHAAVLPRNETPGPPLVTWLRSCAPSFSLVVLAVGALAVTQWYTSWLDALAKAVTQANWVDITLAGVMLTLVVALPLVARRLARSESPFARAYVALWAQPRMGRALAFIITFRLGESFLTKMRTPFLLNQCGLSEATYGMLSGTVGAAAGIGAAILGGMLIARDGLRRWIWPLVLAQNLLNLLYVVPTFASTTTVSLGAIIVAEHVGAGFGTAVLMVYIMRCCASEHRAAHMAILTAVMSIGVTLAGLWSGKLVQQLGWAAFFVGTFVATLPSMALISKLPQLDASNEV